MRKIHLHFSSVCACVSHESAHEKDIIIITINRAFILKNLFSKRESLLASNGSGVKINHQLYLHTGAMVLGALKCFISF